MSSEGPHKGFRFKYLLKSCRQKAWECSFPNLAYCACRSSGKKLMDEFHKHWHICDYDGGLGWETYCICCSDLEERDWILKQLASESSSILSVLRQSSSPLSSSVWITFNTFSGEEMWSLHHSAICPYCTLSSIYFTCSKKALQLKSGFQFPVAYGPHAISDRVWGAWHRAQHFPKRPNNKHTDPHRAEWHIFPSLWRSVVLRIQLYIWSSLCTACSKSATGEHTGSTARHSYGLCAPR